MTATPAEVLHLRTERAGSLARAGQTARAVHEAEAISGHATDATMLLGVARVFARASAEAGNKDAPAHAAGAVGLLRRAGIRGALDGAQLTADADLAPLRGREDYAALLWETADGPEPGAMKP